MSRECPKCHYVRVPTDTAPDYECPRCGVVYAKVEAGRTQIRKPSGSDATKAGGAFSLGVTYFWLVVFSPLLLYLFLVLGAAVGDPRFRDDSGGATTALAILQGFFLLGGVVIELVFRRKTMRHLTPVRRWLTYLVAGVLLLPTLHALLGAVLFRLVKLWKLFMP